MPITSSKSTAGPLVAAARSENFNITIPDAATPDDIGAYPQQLKRSMSTLMSFSFAFTAVGVISSLTALFPTSLSTGGAGVLFWSWITASISTLLTGLSMGGKAYT